MSLDLNLLQKVRPIGSGYTAQCPACAAAGGDRGGQHLKIRADGAFCCVTNPGPSGKWHRREVWQLAGVKEREHREAPMRVILRINRKRL